MPFNLSQFFIRQPRVSSVNDPKTLPPYTQGTVTLQNAFTIKYNGFNSCRMHLTNQKLTTIVNEDVGHADNLNISMSGKTLQDLVNSIISNTNYSATLQGLGADRATIYGVIDQDIRTSAFQVQYAKKNEYLVEVESSGELGDAKVRWTKNDFSFSPIDFQWILKSEAIPTTNITIPASGITNINQGAQIVFKSNSSSAFDVAALKTKTNQVLIQNAGSGTQFINMAVLPKIVSGTLNLVINDVPATENEDYSLSISDKRINFIKGISNEVHISSEEIEYINTNVIGINGIIKDSVEVYKNGTPLTLNQDFYPQAGVDYQGKQMTSGRIFFTKNISEDSLAEYVLTTESSLYGDDLIIKKNGVPLTPDQYLIVFEAGFLNLNEPLFPGDVLTASYISAEDGLITDEILAGSPPSFVSGSGGTGGGTGGTGGGTGGTGGGTGNGGTGGTGDGGTGTGDGGVTPPCGCHCDQQGDGGNTPTVINLAGPFKISAGENDELIIRADGITENILLPIGDAVTLDEIIDQYNSQAQKSLASKNTAGNRLVLSSKSPGSSSTIEILNGSANTTLGFTSGATASGQGSAGGDFAFTLSNAPVVVSSFTAPSGGDTFILRDFNLVSNYPANSLLAIQSDLYIVESSSTDNQAKIYSSSNSTSFRIAYSVNDSFSFKLDDTEHTVTLTSGDRTPSQICDDINIALTETVAEVVEFNGANRIRLKSNSTGLVSNLKILAGSANETLGFKLLDEDTGLLNTVVKIKGKFRQDYENPILRTTRKAVTFITESSAHEKSPAGVSSIFFPSLDITGSYQSNTLIKIGNNLYTVVSSQFTNNKTEVKLTSNLVEPLFTTDVLEKTARPVFAEGETTLVFQKIPINDLPVTIKNNGIDLVADVDYLLNGDGTVTLADAYKLTSSSNITASYTVFESLPENTEVSLNYRFFSSLNEGSKVTASYNYYSPDQFFFDIVYQGDLADALFVKLTEEAEKALNPSSSGYSASAGGDPQNSDSGSETPKFTEYKYRYNESIAYAVYSWLDERTKALTDERSSYNGIKVGANDGYITESNIQDVVNPSSRLFPVGYYETIPKRVPALDGLGQNDDGSTTGSYSSSLDVTPYMNTELSTIDAENILIDSLLLLPVDGANVQGSTFLNTSGLTFYNGTVVVLTGNTTINSTTISNFTSTTTIAVGMSVSGNGIPTGATIVSKAATSIVISSPATATATGVSLSFVFPANNTLILNFNTGTSLTPSITTRTTTFTGSSLGTATTVTSILSAINTAISGYGTATVTQTTSGYIKITATTGSISVGAGLSNSIFGLNNGQVAYTRYTSPVYTSWNSNITTQISEVNAMTPILTTTLGYLAIQMKDYWTDFVQAFNEAKSQKSTINNMISTLTTRNTDNSNSLSMNINVNSNLTDRKTRNSSQKTSLSSFISTALTRVSQINATLTRENLFEKRYAWLSYRADKGTGTLMSIKRAVEDQTRSAQTAAFNKTMSSV